MSYQEQAQEEMWDAIASQPEPGRQARCSCGKLAPSDPGLAFFESRDEGTKAATESCKHCGYTTVAHLLVPTRTQRNVVAEGRCPGFEPKGAWEYDSYYCGHGGWD